MQTKQTLDEFVAAYKDRVSGPCRDLWDSTDERFVERLYNGQFREDDDDSTDSPD